jgi:hypothetical protein
MPVIAGCPEYLFHKRRCGKFGRDGRIIQLGPDELNAHPAETQNGEEP